MIRDYSKQKRLLLDERMRLRNTLLSLGHVHPDDQYDFDASTDEEHIEQGDEADRASQIENFSSRVMLEAELEKRYQEIHAALLSLSEGTYGSCVFCGEEIPLARLEANPAARTCILHTQSVNESSSLL
ncbi:MAG TPA: TraR/DksA family transcriptional regulator [Candidatus Paceibacterota bacterium]|nr:TraR/DksA family transcriptional regulator [Candidatus Paceibacterota bacterium]